MKRKAQVPPRALEARIAALEQHIAFDHAVLDNIANTLVVLASTVERATDAVTSRLHSEQRLRSRSRKPK